MYLGNEKKKVTDEKTVQEKLSWKRTKNRISIFSVTVH
jgi:hypothetical protein